MMNVYTMKSSASTDHPPNAAINVLRSCVDSARNQLNIVSPLFIVLPGAAPAVDAVASFRNPCYTPRRTSPVYGGFPARASGSSGLHFDLPLHELDRVSGQNYLPSGPAQ
jgi:hypothetical protein